MGPTCANVICFPPMTWHTDWNNKSNTNKWNANTRSIKDRHCHDGCQWTSLFCPFPSRRGNPAVFVFFSIKWISLWTCSNGRSSSSTLPEHQIGRTGSLPSPLSTKVLFHCLKNTRVCLKHTLCLWERVVFSFWGDDMFDHVNSPWFLIITRA